MVHAEGLAALFDGDVAGAEFDVAPLGFVVFPDGSAEYAGVERGGFGGVGFGDFYVIEGCEVEWASALAETATAPALRIWMAWRRVISAPVYIR
jgi:hypothetical protein